LLLLLGGIFRLSTFSLRKCEGKPLAGKGNYVGYFLKSHQEKNCRQESNCQCGRWGGWVDGTLAGLDYWEAGVGTGLVVPVIAEKKYCTVATTTKRRQPAQ
jgi:hypothetical protein